MTKARSCSGPRRLHAESVRGQRGEVLGMSRLVGEQQCLHVRAAGHVGCGNRGMGLNRTLAPALHQATMAQEVKVSRKGPTLLGPVGDPGWWTAAGSVPAMDVLCNDGHGWCQTRQQFMVRVCMDEARMSRFGYVNVGYLL